MNKIIGIDIDGTLASNVWINPNVIGPPRKEMVEIVEALYDLGYTLCTWSCRASHVVERWLNENDLRRYFEYINESPRPTESGKASFDVLIDDVAIGAQLSLGQILTSVRALPDTGALLERDSSFFDRNPKLFYQGTGSMIIDHFDDKWEEAWKTKAVENRFNEIAFITNCSHAKPYSKSYIHSSLRKQLFGWHQLERVDYIHISSAGIVSSDAEMVYPFNAYDGNMAEATDETRMYLRASQAARLSVWFATYASRYKHVVIYLRESGNAIHAVRAVANQCPVPLTVVEAKTPLSFKLPYVLDDDPDDALLSYTNLTNLREAFGNV